MSFFKRKISNCIFVQQWYTYFLVYIIIYLFLVKYYRYFINWEMSLFKHNIDTISRYVHWCAHPTSSIVLLHLFALGSRQTFLGQLVASTLGASKRSLFLFPFPTQKFAFLCTDGQAFVLAKQFLFCKMRISTLVRYIYLACQTWFNALGFRINNQITDSSQTHNVRGA